MKLSEIGKTSQSFPNPEAAKLIHSTGNAENKIESDTNQLSLFPNKYSGVNTRREIRSSNFSEEFHSHPFYELLCCHNTCDVEYLARGECNTLQKGDIIIIPPGLSHRLQLPGSMLEPNVLDVIRINTEYIVELSRNIPDCSILQRMTPHIFSTAGTPSEYICDLIYQGIQEAEAGKSGAQIMVTANSMAILIHLLRSRIDLYSKPHDTEKPELMQQFLDYVEKHQKKKITLGDIARHFYISESTVTQTFRKKMRISFYRYVTQRRLIAAKPLIESGIPLESVAEQVGFTDYSSFFRSFKQEYGMSPRQFRKMQQK